MVPDDKSLEHVFGLTFSLGDIIQWNTSLLIKEYTIFQKLITTTTTTTRDFQLQIIYDSYLFQKQVIIKEAGSNYFHIFFFINK